MITIPLSDIYTAAFLELHGIDVQLSIEKGRVSFEVEPTDEVINGMRDFTNNVPVPVMDFVQHLRSLRGRMIGMKK